MGSLTSTALPLLVILAFIDINEASAPFFLQAITSALGTIPFTAGPMTTGLVGAKLAVGSKLLYYLGFFGRRRPKPSLPKTPALLKVPSRAHGFGSNLQLGGMQVVPLPYAFGAGGYPQQFGMGGPAFGQYPFGYDQAQLFQMMAAQGIDPTTAMQALTFDGGNVGQPIPASQFPFGTMNAGSTFGQTRPIPGGSQGMPNPNMPQAEIPDSPSEDSESEVESFFAFLRDMDDNTCISRLMCDIGANPSFLGEFSENIHGIIGTLDVTPSSGAYQYISIMKMGQSEGNCGQRFSQCNDAAYEIVKNIAPSVGMPQNININAVNRL